MGLAPAAPLVAGDVVTVEPGLYRPGFGGCRLEDLVLVTEDGCENLTSYPYDLDAMTEGIETLLHEERRYAPSPEFAAQANAQPGIHDIPFEEFWAQRGPRARDMVRRLPHGARVGGAVREMVRRRHAQRLLQLPRPARGGGQGREGRLLLRGRARGRPGAAHVPGAARRGRPRGERAEGGRREEGHAGRHLHGYGTWTAGGDARVRAPRRATHRRLRRLLGRLARRPDQRHEVRGRDHAGRGLAPRADASRSRRTSTRRSSRARP